ncbi:hypothetical protein ACOSQ2_010120 [Xanthoceras sorbifolium]
MIHISGSGADEHIELSMIISSWVWSYFTVEKRKKTSISKFNSGVARSLLFGCEAVSNQNTQQALALPEKEVIQPHLPVRLPCYDFTPVTSPAFGTPLLAVKVTTSGMASSHSVTGGVYKARERIHRRMADRRLLAILASCRRVAACNPN